jgi:cyanophycinase
VDKKNNSFNQTIVNQIRQCTGWFFGGGDQRRVTDSLFYNDTNGARQPTPALIALWETFNINGGMIGGSSAGTSCQPTNPMITDGTSYYGILKGAIVDGTIPNDDDNYLTFDPAGGIGVFPYGLLDTHFADRGRQGRFMMLALASRDLGNASIGYGMDQNTAISVNLNSKTATVVGTQGVTICQSKDAKWAKGEPYTTVYNMRCSYATPYDKIDLATGKISFASYKTPLVGREGPDHALASNDIFNSPDNPNGGQVAIKQFVLAATSLFNSTDNQSLSYTWETQPMRFGITMTKDAQSVGYEGTVVGISFTSYQDLRVDITPMP